MLWIYLFVVVGISCFLILMYKGRKEDLRKCILSRRARKRISEDVNDLRESLQDKQNKSGVCKRKLKANRQTSVKSMQKILINDLKKDVMKSEKKLTDLENEIKSLSRRRESIKYEISKQQKEYDECMQIFMAHEFGKEANKIES